jgi:DNA-binding MarR family transcriptional regulator
MPNFDLLKLDNQLCHAIYSASNALARFYKPVLDELNLTYPQYLIMLALWEKDGINILSISKATFFDSGTLTPLLQKLKQKSLIEMKADESDGRSKIVQLSAKGRALKNKAVSVPEKLICIMPFELKEAERLKSLAAMLHQAILDAESKAIK